MMLIILMVKVLTSTKTNVIIIEQFKEIIYSG